MIARCVLATFVAAFVFLPRGARAESAIAPATIIMSDRSIVEGDQGTKPFAVEVKLIAPTRMMVEVSAAPGTANGQDFMFDTVRLDMMPNQTVVVSGTIIGDLLPEGDEDFKLRATLVQGYGAFTQGGTITIVDDDSARASRLYVDPASQKEGDAISIVDVPVRLQPPSPYPVTVKYQTVDGTARVAEGDYVSASGTLSFEPGEVLKAVPVEIRGNAIWSTNKTFLVTLTAPTWATIAVAQAEITIVDDDPPAVPVIDDVKIVEGSSGWHHEALIMRFSHPVPPYAKAGVRVVGGSARGKEDYALAEMTYYPTGDVLTIPLDIAGDNIGECDEGILIEYGSIYTGDDTRKFARVLITNDDPINNDLLCSDPFAPMQTPPDGGSGGNGGASGKDGGEGDVDGGAGGKGGGTGVTTAPDGAASSLVDGGSSSKLADGGSFICSFNTGSGSSAAWPLVLAALAGVARRRRRS